MSSPRWILLDAFAAILSGIRLGNGYRTDAGMAFTREPTPQSADESAEFVTAVWTRQERASDQALIRTHRLTTVEVIAKVPAALDSAQERLDAIAADIERAFSGRQKSFPAGCQFPQYQGATPLTPQQPGAGWVGVSITYTSHIPISL